MNARRWTAVALAVGLTILYWDLFDRLAYAWLHYEYAGHGMFVPILAAVMAVRERRQLGRCMGAGHWKGLVLVVAGLAIFGSGLATGSIVVETFSVPLVTAGLVVLAFGTRLARRAAFQIAYLVLMVPVPQQIIDAVTLHVQMFAANVAGAALGVFGIPFFRTGVMIELAGVTLHVAEACNGLRFLLGLFAITLAYAYVMQDRTSHRAVLAAAAIPVAILANALRVAGIATAAHFYGPEAVAGTPHFIIGKVVWIGTIGGLLALGFLMRRFEDKVRGPVTVEA
jgi:exosortase